MLSAEQQADLSQATPGPAIEEEQQARTCDGNLTVLLSRACQTQNDFEMMPACRIHIA